MFNPDLKNAFLDTQKAEKTKSTIRTLFNKTEPHEAEHGDLYTWSPETIIAVFRKLGFATVGTARVSLSITRQYFEYCSKQGLPHPIEATLVQETQLINPDSYKSAYVGSAEELQEYLDSAFADDIQNDIRVRVYKAYYWLAFSGVPTQDVMKVTPKTIQGDTITVEGRTYYIHESAQKLIYDISRFLNPNIPLLHVFSERITPSNIRNFISSLKKPEVPRLKYTNVYKSGLFRRIYEQEKQGFLARFDAEVEMQIQLTGYAGHGYSLQKRKRTMQATLLKDYNAWKTAFGL